RTKSRPKPAAPRHVASYAVELLASVRIPPAAAHPAAAPPRPAASRPPAVAGHSRPGHPLPSRRLWPRRRGLGGRRFWVGQLTHAAHNTLCLESLKRGLNEVLDVPADVADSLGQRLSGLRAQLGQYLFYHLLP